MSSKQSNKQSSKQSKQAKQIGEDIWKNQTVKINSELFTLTYGSIVAQICREECYDYQKVNDILFNMGRNIGVRLIEEFLSKSSLERCTSLKETSEIITKIGFKMFLNIVPNISFWSPDGRTFQITLIENPLSDFVELPDDIDDVEYDYDNENNNDNENRIINGLEDLSISGNGNGNGNEESNSNKNRKGNARRDLWYSNILCGVLKGALEMVQLDCQVWFVSDILRGDATTDIRVKLVQVLKDEIPDGDE